MTPSKKTTFYDNKIIYMREKERQNRKETKGRTEKGEGQKSVKNL